MVACRLAKSSLVGNKKYFYSRTAVQDAAQIITVS